MNADKVFWIAYLALGVVYEAVALLRMWLNRDPNARTLTQVVEPWIRKNWATRLIWWAVAVLASIHLGTGLF